tara:strand:+ start:415 stop:936 length:522 start_codon:yes stop_codon:yes gene_type:complete
MKKLKFLIIFLFLISPHSSSIADIPHYLDFKYILNSSDAGKKAQDNLKNSLENGLKDLSKKEKKLVDEEKKIIGQKKVISQEEYKKKVSDLRKKVSNLQKERNALLESVAKNRAKAKEILLKNLNPIVKNYMIEKKIRMVVDKKNLLLADDKLDITKDIMNLLNQKLKTINIK